MAKVNRGIKITFRVSDNEMIEIDKLCRSTDLSLSQLIRLAILVTKNKFPEMPLEEKKMLIESMKSGNSIHPSTRSINAGFMKRNRVLGSNE